MRSGVDRRGIRRRIFTAAILSTLAAAPPFFEGAEGDREAGDGPSEDFHTRIDRAIKKGRKHLLPFIETNLASPPDPYLTGRIALNLAALLRAGVETDHPLIRRSFEYLEKRSLERVYTVTCYLMALDSLVLARAREERMSKRKELTQDSPVQVRAEGKVRKRMEELILWLLKTRNPGEGTWHYRGEGGYDHSNTQFAVLGIQIGLEHGILVPKTVYQEIAVHFSQLRIEKAEAEVPITYNASWKALLKGKGAEVKTIRRAPGGWGYTQRDAVPYASMTAAGASCLLVARNGLEGSLPKTAQAALESSLAWIAVNFDTFFVGRNYYFYALYSLEKVGDLGDIASFGERDWYREGAEALIDLQTESGSWGDSIDTSFALLFLTRATRPSMRALPPPRVVTGQGAGSAEGGDLVRIDSVGGSISAREFFEQLYSARDRDLLKIAAEVMRNYPLSRQGELIPWILPLLSERTDAVDAFARKALREITGETFRAPEEYLKWHEVYTAIRGLESGGKDVSGLAAELLRKAPGLRLKGTIIETISRLNLIDCGPALIEELRLPDPEYRKRVAEILARLSGEKPVNLEFAEKEGAEAVAIAWRALWQEKGDMFLVRARIRRTIDLLDAMSSGNAEESGERTEGLLSSLVREGRAAVPSILEAMSRPEYPARLLQALERITGKRLGLRPEPWRDWWEKEGGKAEEDREKKG